MAVGTAVPPPTGHGADRGNHHRVVALRRGGSPEGYQLVLAGRGDILQTWSSDSFGDDEPVTVLVPPGGDIAGRGAVTVSLTGYAGFEGGLEQAAVGYPAVQPEGFEIDGQRALYTPPGVSPAGPHGAEP
jgi:hypothetical protein